MNRSVAIVNFILRCESAQYNRFCMPLCNWQPIVNNVIHRTDDMVIHGVHYYYYYYYYYQKG